MIYPALRCDKCDINYPAEYTQYRPCPICGAETKSVCSAQMQPLSGDSLREAMVDRVIAEEPKHEYIHNEQVYAHRFAKFMRMGFGPAESRSLANTFIDTHEVDRWLNQGCSVDVAVSILL